MEYITDMSERHVCNIFLRIILDPGPGKIANSFEEGP